MGISWGLQLSSLVFWVRSVSNDALYQRQQGVVLLSHAKRLIMMARERGRVDTLNFSSPAALIVSLIRENPRTSTGRPAPTVQTKSVREREPAAVRD